MDEAYKSFTALVVDDEPLARAHLAHLLREAGVGGVAQAASGAECLTRLSGAAPPNWVFLDIQMPGMDGLTTADAIREDLDLDIEAQAPAVVFVTGYDEYAVAAFERAAIDYLLKPVERARLAKTLRRLAAREPSEDAAAPTTPLTSLRKLPVRAGYSIHLVDIDDIVAAAAVDKHVDIITPTAALPSQYTLAQLEALLPEEQFSRVHDGWVVNLTRITQLHSLGSQLYQLSLKDYAAQVPVSRRRISALRARLGLE
ncbi:DNA-binding response regulator [Capsulimonas corticalis]|uniref:DNA-binding response regulator n=1 Tax=Capsulimonas corticalis TaxID=2219043 RepID=A0A402CRK5_9BACT|nr:LytTR family DNA-binding domain-containing protein [Capsulimonas corticalis]BDI28129.1 DNA-binding response regulator [Capsulimonas corticalis]